jgi:hypothetical protein
MRVTSHTSAAPPLRFVPLQRFLARNRGFGVSRGSKPRTPCACRFSQPPDALLRPVPAGRISDQIRSWGSPSRAFFLPRSRTPSPAPLPSGRSPTRQFNASDDHRDRSLRSGSEEKTKNRARRLAFRVLLHARVRYHARRFRPHGARSSPGVSPLQGAHPHRNGTAFTAPPLMRLQSLSRGE